MIPTHDPEEEKEEQELSFWLTVIKVLFLLILFFMAGIGVIIIGFFVKIVLLFN